MCVCERARECQYVSVCVCEWCVCVCFRISLRFSHSLSIAKSSIDLIGSLNTDVGKSLSLPSHFLLIFFYLSLFSLSILISFLIHLYSHSFPIPSVFHPTRMEVVINSQVWDLRTFKLLHTVPAFDQTKSLSLFSLSLLSLSSLSLFLGLFSFSLPLLLLELKHMG